MREGDPQQEWKMQTLAHSECKVKLVAYGFPHLLSLWGSLLSLSLRSQNSPVPDCPQFCGFLIWIPKGGEAVCPQWINGRKLVQVTACSVELVNQPRICSDVIHNHKILIILVAVSATAETSYLS